MTAKKKRIRHRTATDRTRMPYGKYRGTRMYMVPARHLLGIYNTPRCPEYIRKYIEANMESLHAEFIKTEDK